MTHLTDSGPGRAAVTWLGIALVSLLGLVLLTIALMNKVVIPFDQSLLVLAGTWAGWQTLWDAM